MLMLSLARTLAVTIPWMLNLAIWILARSLQLPEPLVHDAGAFVFAQVQAVENGIGKALCPRRLAHRLQSLIESPVQRCPPTTPRTRQ